MIKKYLFIAFAIISISVVSCRQDEDLPAVEVKSTEILGQQKKSNKSDSSSYSKSSDSTDTPENGTHWKINDSIRDGISDPPVNTTHWRIKN